MNRKQDGDAANGTIPVEKDETELRLEKILFGDDDGFLRGLQDPSSENQLVVARERDQSEDDEPGPDAVNFEDVADEQVCSLISRVSNRFCALTDRCAHLALFHRHSRDKAISRRHSPRNQWSIRYR